MLRSYFSNLEQWLTFHALYEYAVEGKEELQDGICAYYDSFVSGTSLVSVQHRMRNSHSSALAKISKALESNRLSRLRSYFKERPTFYA
jgi:hypothetical protein